jgi:sugar lactone lactonase YvrE/peroxiredoxin
MMKNRSQAVMILLAVVLALILSFVGFQLWRSASPEPGDTPVPAVTISGFVFRDLNGDGVRDAREPGEPNIAVSAYDAAENLVATAETDVNGDYVLGVDVDQTIVAGESYVVVFSGWPENLSPGPHGEDSNTEQQFVVGGADDVNFGLFSADQYVPPQATADAILTREPAGPAPTAQVTGEYGGVEPAPDFPAGLDWLNTSHPLTWADLRGKVVLLEFWTYGCIHCIHVTPQLKMLQEKYAEELVIIGVHTAKFPHEGETENIRRIIQRYELTYPVVNDKDYVIARQYSAHIWPTFVIVNPEGRYLGSREGDLWYAQIDRLIAEIVAEFDAHGLMDRTPLDLGLELDSLEEMPLRFPGAVLADEANDRLFIVDSNHNRIVIADLAGNVQDVIGSGEPALRDGDYEAAAFRQPQGVTQADGDTLYVADTMNHTIRRVDLVSRTVTTVAGVGERILTQADTGPALESRLNYPWDIVYVDGLVYIAMAGQHQIWTYDPAEERVASFAGNGTEEMRDGALLVAGFNQPMALTSDGSVLYVADSEASAIREVDLNPSGNVRTIVGLDFYAFGDVDGTGSVVRMQRPVGIAYQDGLLYVADTYNNKIKTVDPQTGETRTFVGTGESGWRDGTKPLFYDPSGLSIATDKLYVADTNNHVIRVVDLVTREVSTLVLVDPKGLLE